MDNEDQNQESKHSSVSLKAVLPFPEALRGKRVLLATESLGPINGVSRTTSNLIEYLHANGVHLALVAPRQEQSHKDTQTARGEQELRLNGYPLPYDPTLSIVFPFRLDRLFQRTFTPDIIYLASPASLGFQVLLQLRQLRHQPPVLLNFQTDLSAYCEILFPTPLDKWAVWVFKSVQGYLFRYKAVQTVFYPSSYVGRYLMEAGVEEDKMRLLRRGVNCEAFHPGLRDKTYRRGFTPNNEILLVCVARLAPEKGFEFLAKVAEKLAERGFAFHLLIVGSNKNPAIVQKIEDLFISSLLKGKVTFTGLLRGEDLGRAYASADIFLHCSITETFGLVVLESMASGVPVIARDEGGPSDTVQHNDSGFLVPPDDLEQFVARVEELGKDVDLRKRMSERGLVLAGMASWEKINNQVAWKLAEALSSGGNSGDMEANASTALLRPEHTPRQLRPVASTLSTIVERFRLLGSLFIINGVWAGVVITWGMAETLLLAKRFLKKLGI